MTKPIVVVGSINLDLVVTAERIPMPGETIAGESFKTYFGGKGANQAVAIGKLGYPVKMLGKVGTDSFGAQLRDAISEAGVDASAVETASGSSGVAVISTTHRGENCITVVPGANGEITSQDLDHYRGLIEGAGMVLTQLEIPMPVTEHLAEMTSRARVPLMLDPAPARALSDRLLASVDWITPNETETRMLLDLDGSDWGPDAATRAAEALLDRGSRNIVLKMGERGAFLAESNGNRILIPAYAVKAVDSTAAGDAFNGGFAVGLMLGKSPEESARFASAVAAISVTRHGAQPSMPSAAEVERFIEAQTLMRS
ncbi:MAG TPA: ribokinase [Dongiaceae bacterium]|nr:ribokinase [Dongiaceae bacterium]